MTPWSWVHDTQVYMGLGAAQSLGIKKATGRGPDPGNQYDFGAKWAKNISRDSGCSRIMDQHMGFGNIPGLDIIMAPAAL